MERGKESVEAQVERELDSFAARVREALGDEPGNGPLILKVLEEARIKLEEMQGGQ